MKRNSTAKLVTTVDWEDRETNEVKVDRVWSHSYNDDVIMMS